ncbi:CRISPR-associated protein Cas2 [Alteribacter lacisalsi]|uniref:CRISPR-associated protein Cas2 n=1 Tax=Alteribacter lacisalsi TaxID=2045244 RepID=A0A2W0H7M8_9BACI|nr:AAA family ATPase [Alteribacter lacisalsi]PYZ96736.1 CRISPR-associated protein Cas2 [Alteribacter lacisalsi]
MKRLAIITVGKTHSGKTTFAKALEKKLDNAFVMDQDHHAAFINTHYKKLEPKQGPNTLKHAISKAIVRYAIDQTDYHIISCNANRSAKGRKYLLEELYGEEKFIRIIVHFDLPDDVLFDRVTHSQRSTNIFRGPYTDFKEVLLGQQAESGIEDVADPEEGEADHLFVIKDSGEAESVIKKIVHLSRNI